MTLRAEGDILMDDADSDSVDPAYDSAGVIMKSLHAQKLGQPFNKVTIDYVIPFSDSLVLPDDHTGDDDEYRTRHFASRINNAGVYEQWGSERCVVPEDGVEEDPDDDSDGHSNGGTNIHFHGGNSGDQDSDVDADLTETSSHG